MARLLSNDIQSYQAAAPALTFDHGKIDVIRQTVAKGATNNELEMFLHLCSTYQLDPFRKEIWFIKYGGQGSEPTIMTSRDGYLKIAQQHPDYLGIMSQEVRSNDFFELDAAAGTVSHRFAQPISQRGPIVGAWATVKRKGVDPVSVFVNYDEYKGQSKIWKQYPSAMIIKVAETFALKRQFGITGLVTREEMEVQGDFGPDAPQMPQNDPGAFQGVNTQQGPPKSHSEHPVQPGGEIEVIPSAADVLRTCELLGWTPEQMIKNVNLFLEKNNQQPVKKWGEVNPRFKAAFYTIMINRLQKDLGGETK